MYKKPLPALSPAETEILRLVWQLEAARVQQMCDALPADRAYATVQTLLRRLEQKGYVKPADRETSQGRRSDPRTLRCATSPAITN